MQRFVRALTKPGDVVLDPFCGCGTTIHAAQKLQRSWIGIDITHLAISLIEKRLREAFPSIKYEVYGTPKDLDGAIVLADQDKYQFQWWVIISLLDAVPYGGKRKGADSGIDGIIYFKTDKRTTEKAIVSVKGGANVGVSMIRELINIVDREGARIGIFVSLSAPTKPMQTEALKAGFFEMSYGKYPKIQLLTIEDLLNGKRPRIPFVDKTVFKKAKEEELVKQQKLL